MEILLGLTVLMALALLAFIALGVEDKRFQESWAPPQYEAEPVPAVCWDDRISVHQPLPWLVDSAA